MLTKPGLDKIKTHLYERVAETADEDSGIWLYLDFLAELTDGYLAYRPLIGDVESLEEILDHNALIVSVDHDGGIMTPYIHGGTSAEADETQSDLQQFLLHTLPGSETLPQKALETLSVVGRKVAAAVTVSRARSERPAVMIFYSPLLTERETYAAIKGAILA